MLIRSIQEFNRYFLKHFLLLFLSLIFLCFLTYLYLITNPELAKETVRAMIQGLEDKGISQGTNQFKTFLIVLINNCLLSFIMVLLGFIPLIILPIFTTALTFFALSAVLSLIHINNASFELFYFGILPHGLFEFASFTLSSLLGIYLSFCVLKSIFKKNKEKLFISIKRVFASYFFVALPIMIIAGLIEGFVTPILIHRFLL